MSRVIAYIDGFNLYHGLLSAKWRRFLWLNVKQLAQNLLKPDQQLLMTKYFTARTIIPDAAKQQRQTTYIEAIQAIDGIKVIEGRYHDESYTCPRCAFGYSIPREKMTDINISVEMLNDTYNDLFDIALLISADSDLVPLVNSIKTSFPHKKTLLALPPKRYSAYLVNVVDAHIFIGKTVLSQSLLPDEVVRADGYLLQRPDTWR